MPTEAHHIVWPIIVSGAFFVHYLSGCLNAFKDIQDEAINNYALEKNLRFNNRKSLIDAIKVDKIPVSLSLKNKYVIKTIFFWFACVAISIAAILSRTKDTSIHIAIVSSCSLMFIVSAISLFFIAFKYFKEPETISVRNWPAVDFLYEWMPFADDAAFAVVIAEFALFWFE